MMTPKNTIPLALSGRFKLVVSRDAEARDVVSEHEFKNLILDSGLELLGTVASQGFISDICQKFHVGTGTSTPNALQTSLDARIATTAGNTTVESRAASYDDGYCEEVYTKQFAQGAAAGNLSEIGVGASATNLFSRARILDGGGNPTTITVLPTEYLTVYYTLRCTIPKTDQVYSITANIDGVLTPVTVTIRPANANNASQWALRTTFPPLTTTATVYAGAIGTPISQPSGASSAITGSASRSGYVALSRQIFANYDIGISQGNVAGGQWGAFVYIFGPGQWQMGFDPKIPKDNTKSISMTIGYSWDRA